MLGIDIFVFGSGKTSKSSQHMCPCVYTCFCDSICVYIYVCVHFNTARFVSGPILFIRCRYQNSCKHTVFLTNLPQHLTTSLYTRLTYLHFKRLPNCSIQQIELYRFIEELQGSRLRNLQRLFTAFCRNQEYTTSLIRICRMV